jgi:very-short-patch-repair endonuclease
MSEPEVMLWSRLRGRTPERPTFRRQHPIGTIIVDFFCPSAQLAIEVDGATHWDDEARAKDAARDRSLETQGIAVLRIPAGEIHRDLSGAVDAILLRAEERRAEMSRMRPAPSTTPSAGRGPPPADPAGSGEVGRRR